MRWLVSVHWPIGLAYCIAALALDWVSNIGLYRGLGVTPWTPASGLAVAYAFIFGSRSAPGLFCAELLTLVIVNKAGFPIHWIVILSSIATLFWLAGGRTLRAMPEFDAGLGSVQSVLRLFVVATLQAIGASLAYLLALWATGNVGEINAFAILWRLVVGHVVGIIIVAPIPLMMHGGWRVLRPTAERLLQVLILLAALWIVFNYRAATAYQLFYLLFLPILWSALKDGIGGSALMLNFAQIGIILGAQFRTDIIPSTGSLQILMITLALTGLLVGAVVTDRQAAGQRLRDQQSALARALRLRSAGETAAAISHQINQPITAITTYAAVARDALDRNDATLARTAMARLSEECDRAAAVTKSIRDLVKQGSLSSAPMHVHDVVENVRQSHMAACAASGIKLEIDAPATLPTIVADKIQLEQAIDNLVTNSIESIRDGGRGSRIRITAAIDVSGCQIEIEDDGAGFAPGLDALATTPFITTKNYGSGLGLAIARSVAEAHGGSLAIVPRSSGACIRLRLPTSGKAT